MNKSPTILTIITLLSLSMITPSIVFADPLATSAKDWQYTNGNSWAWNYSPETQINKNNLDQLEVKWIFPLEPRSSASPKMSLGAINEGTTTPPIVANGRVYVTTNYLRTYAIDANTGKLSWVHNYVVDFEDLENRLPVLSPAHAGALGIINAHLHGIRYWEGGNALLINGQACDFYGVDATTGTTSFWVKDLCLDVPGNLYKYRQGTASQDGVATYEAGNQFIYYLPGAMHSFIFNGDARAVMMGIDMETHQILWRIYNFPPQDRPTKDWALQECDIGYFQDIPCSTVAAQAPENLEWDWAQPNEPPSIYGGVTATWGVTATVDEETGVLYTQTGNQGPFTYIGATPGPRLYGSTIMAIDLNKGERVWWLQPFPRDPYDYDCDYDGILADVQDLGKVYIKGCKEGRLYVLDAATGEPIYITDVIDEQYQWGQISEAGTKEPNDGGVKYHLNDPFSHYDMREMESPDNSNYCGRPCPLYPMFLNGIFATDTTYDPETETLYHYAAALQATLQNSPPPTEGGSTAVYQMSPIMNTTIVSRDVATGQVNWTWFYGASMQRAHMVVTHDLLFSGFTDGRIRFFDKASGEELGDLNLGSDILVGPTIGEDSKGNPMIFSMIGVGAAGAPAFGGITPVVPGTVVGIGLSERAGGEVSTTTMTSTVATTQTQTTTMTSQITETVGMPAEITYAAVAVAVIAIIAAAVLVTRRK
jgi:outer membrane protein assembly factor BamB